MKNMRTVAQINRMVRSIVESETLEQYFWVAGVVQGYKRSDRGHQYFRLLDEDKSIECALYEGFSGNLDFELRNGQRVEVYGEVRFYETWGRIEIKVFRARLKEPVADARPAVEILRAEGLYPPKKRPPPKRIRRIGIITSRSSRAIGDFENAYRTAAEGATLPPYDFHYALVEGEQAPQRLSDAIGNVGRDDSIDAIVVMRGGSRSDSLAIFDDARIARAILRCGKYVITGIGHHLDRTLADDVADHAAATPTAAAHYIASICRPVALESPAQPTPPAAPAPSPALSTRLKIALAALAILAIWLFIIFSISQLGV